MENARNQDGFAPASDWVPLALSDDDHAVLGELTGQQIAALGYEKDGDSEALYVLTKTHAFAIGAEPIRHPGSAPSWPFRLSFQALEGALPLIDQHPFSGRIEEATLFEDGDRVVRGGCLKIEGGDQLWFWNAGGDFVDAQCTPAAPSYFEELVLVRSTRFGREAAQGSSLTMGRGACRL